MAPNPLIPHQPKTLAKNRKGAALAEYAVILLLISAASLGAIWTFGGQVKDIFDDTATVIHDNGYEIATVDTPGSTDPVVDEEDGYGPKDRDPGGGLVDGADVLYGCPLPAGTEYYRARHAVNIPIWSYPVTDPEDNPEPIRGEVVGPYWDSLDGTYYLLPSDLTLDTYFEKGPIWHTGVGTYWYFYTGRISFADNTATYAFRNCSDRTQDGPRRPDYDPPANSSTLAVATAGAFQDDAASGGILGFINGSSDRDWYRVEVTTDGGSLRAQAKPTLVEGMVATGLGVNLRDASGGLVSGANSTSGTMLATALPAGTYFLDVSNTNGAYDDTGGYVLTSGLVADTPNTYEGALDLFPGDVWVEDLLTGDSGDRFHITVPEGSESSVLVTAKGAGSDPMGRVFVYASEITNEDTSAAKSLLDTNGTSLSYLFSHVATDSGLDYYVRMSPSSSYRGTYQISAEEVHDVSPFTGRAHELTIGERFEARFWASNDVDMYRFDNPAAQQVRIEIIENNASNADNSIMSFSVYDQDMTLVKSSSNSSNSGPGEITLDRLPAGRFFVRAGTPYGGTSNYTILVETIDDTPASFEYAGALQFGENHSEDIASGDDVDMFRFMNGAEQHVRVRARSSGPSENITLTIFEKTGDGQYLQRATRSQSPDADILLNDLAPGEFYARVATTYDETVNYILDVAAIDDTTASFEDARGNLALGTPHSETLSVRLDEDIYHVYNPVAQDMLFSATGAKENMTLTIFDSDKSTIVASATGMDAATIVNALDEGDYYVRIKLTYPSSADPTSYTVLVRPVTDTPGTHDTAKEHTYGTVHEEDIATFTDIDYFKVILTDPLNEVRFSATGDESLSMTIYDGNKNVVKSATYGTSIKIEYTDLPPDTYYVRLTTRYSKTSDYRFYIGDTGGSSTVPAAIP